jgi:N-acetylglucosaminyldiphosphoundecaprenol N-acetyl-beta-D-mannosaminyltransferase
MNYFNINLEFNHTTLHNTITDFAVNHKKGYICVIDANVFTMAQKDKEYLNILNSSTINTCDGSSIALLAGKIHKCKFKALNGPTLFSHYIEKSQYKQLLLGSSEEVLNDIQNMLLYRDLDNKYLEMMPLPFLSSDQFDYMFIAHEINAIQPDIIWVSLGAPKQEIFMSKILPYLNQGLMFGIGAAFNFYIGKIDLPRIKIGTLQFIWLSRLIAEPKKLYSRLLRYIFILPKLYVNEKKKVKTNNTHNLP